MDERRRRLSDVSEFPRGDYGVGSPLIRGETELDATEHMTQGPPESIHHHDDSHFAPDSRRGDEDHDTMGVGLRNLGGHTPPHQDGGTRHALRDFLRSDQGSLGDQVYEQELYKLRMKPTRTGATHQTWDMTRADPGELMPEIPDSDAGFQGGDMYHEQRGTSPGPAKDDAHNWHPPGPAAWQRIHQTLLDWAVAWSPSELDKALNSTTRGNQVDSLALSVWTMQTYKRYVRLKLSENPPGNIDKMFVPPIIADVVSNAVFSGRHAEASDQLRKLWNDFGLKGSPRQIIVLAPNKRQENHWVVHRCVAPIPSAFHSESSHSFDLSECTLNTYDTSIEKSPPDSRVRLNIQISGPFPDGPRHNSLWVGGLRLKQHSRTFPRRSPVTFTRTTFACLVRCSTSLITRSPRRRSGVIFLCPRKQSAPSTSNVSGTSLTPRLRTYASARRWESSPPPSTLLRGNKWGVKHEERLGHFLGLATTEFCYELELTTTMSCVLLRCM